MRVEGTVNQEPCQLTVDTGAERTFVRPDVLTVVAPLSTQQLCGVTGHCTPLQGPVEATIGVGSQEVKLPVYVADIEDSCLLGLDYYCHLP